ncbi:unnamed protein product [Cyprideis torosa]|uniref:Uncharacterized protein n=1 Tax=Cyprideis torosa TaxID=163714 RepID=A0A7R8W8F0_9CRUS|nr:unnamed protein product [Cyprideis torosa]CAG0888516.1 unnamed protein product [Cyprideis torosa]
MANRLSANVSLTIRRSPYANVSRMNIWTLFVKKIVVAFVNETAQALDSAVVVDSRSQLIILAKMWMTLVAEFLLCVQTSEFLKKTLGSVKSPKTAISIASVIILLDGMTLEHNVDISRNALKNAGETNARMEHVSPLIMVRFAIAPVDTTKKRMNVFLTPLNPVESQNIFRVKTQPSILAATERCGPTSCHETAQCLQNENGKFSCECYDFEVKIDNPNQSLIQCQRPASCSNSTIIEECASKNRMCKEYPQGEIPYECICRPPRVPVNDSCVQIGQNPDSRNRVFTSSLPLVLQKDPASDAFSREELEMNVNEAFGLAFSSKGIISSSVIGVKERLSAHTRSNPHPSMRLRQWLRNPQVDSRDAAKVYEIETALLFPDEQFGSDDELVSAIKGTLSAEKDGHCILPGGKLVIKETDVEAIEANTDFNPCNQSSDPCASSTVFYCEHTPGISGSFVCKCRDGYRVYNSDESGNEQCEDIDECKENSTICDAYGEPEEVVCINKPDLEDELGSNLQAAGLGKSHSGALEGTTTKPTEHRDDLATPRRIAK